MKQLLYIDMERGTNFSGYRNVVRKTKIKKLLTKLEESKK